MGQHSPAPRRSGRALVIARDGRRFVCDATVENGLIHLANVRRRLGSGDDLSHAIAEDRVLPGHAIRELRWLSEEW